MKIKVLVISILLLVSCVAVAGAQEVAKTNAGKDGHPIAAAAPGTPSAGASQAGMPALPAALPAAPALKTESLFYIRDLQYEQAKLLLGMKQLEAQYKKLQEDVDRLGQSVNAIVEADAKAANIDLSKWSFDTDKLKFVPREKPAPATQPSPKP